MTALLKTEADSVELRWGGASWMEPVFDGMSEIVFDVDGISAGPSDLMAVVRESGAEYGPWHLKVERR